MPNRMNSTCIVVYLLSSKLSYYLLSELIMDFFQLNFVHLTFGKSAFKTRSAHTALHIDIIFTRAGNEQLTQVSHIDRHR